MPHGCTNRRRLPRSSQRFAVCALVLVNLAAFNGCKHSSKRPQWNDGECRYEQTIHSPSGVGQPVRGIVAKCVAVPLADTLPALKLAQLASDMEAAGDPKCVDVFYAAARQAWLEVVSLGDRPARTDLQEVTPPYHACVAKLIVSAQRFQRIDPDRGIKVFDHGRTVIVPFERYGFNWQSEDFNNFELVGDYELGKHGKATRSSGLGVPLVVKRVRSERDEFYRPIHPFAATAVLCPRVPRALEAVSAARKIRPVSNEIAPELLPEQACFELRLYNPTECTQVELAGARWPLATDQTAPLAWQMSTATNNPVRDFLRPDTEKPQLLMLEPYQAGKIPVVFVHGLLSDPSTWVDLGNQLRAQSWFRKQYQVWVFRYPTSTPFLVSAAVLRRELNAALGSAPEAKGDLAANYMVLIGHSMGGLVSKLQVAESGPDLWNLVANKPLDQLNASSDDREQLRQIFFFKPQPFVHRVIFIGTPHRGSTMATRAVGRAGSLVAHSTNESQERHQRLVADNPGALKSNVSGRIPTSVDLLEPTHPLLKAMECLQISPCVQMHSIIGVSKTTSCEGPSDGMVTLDSATLRGVASELLVNEKHTDLHHAATTISEIERILQLNVRDYQRALARDTP